MVSQSQVQDATAAIVASGADFMIELGDFKVRPKAEARHLQGNGKPCAAPHQPPRD